MALRTLFLSAFIVLPACGDGTSNTIPSSLVSPVVSASQAGNSDPSDETINGLRVPPDPGLANNQTLPGIDVDGNGIRDDIDRFIAANFSQSDEKLKAARLLAKIEYLKFLKPTPTTRVEAEALTSLRFKNFECYVKETGDPREFRQLPSLIQSLYLNSESRYRHVREIARLSNGMSILFNTEPKDYCVQGIK